PPGVVAPPFILQNGIFQLDVDDEIWQDIGLDDDAVDPPLWLSDEDVHMGIRHLLEYDRCEEEARLSWECAILQEWMISEWNSVQQTRDEAGTVRDC
ncbi:hypothetical protein PAXINDRAFT_70654, partial [Paxillus involutus ATCC 200175]